MVGTKIYCNSRIVTRVEHAVWYKLKKYILHAFALLLVQLQVLQFFVVVLIFTIHQVINNTQLLHTVYTLILQSIRIDTYKYAIVVFNEF